MSFAHGIAHAPVGSLGDWFKPGTVPSPRMAPALNPRDNSTTSAGNNTVNMFIDSVSDEFRYGASIVSACADQTIYALQCTAGPTYVPGVGSIGRDTCGPSASILTVTSGASIYEGGLDTSTVISGISVTVTGKETCALAGTTTATCTATAQATASTTSTSTTSTETLSGTDYYRFNVAITGGAEKTANPTGTCGAKTNAAASFSSKKVVIWTLAGVAVASIQAML